MAKLRTPAVPVFPLANTQYRKETQDQLTNVIRLYCNQLNNVVGAVIGNEGGQYLTSPYGAFYDSSTQTIAQSTSVTAVQFGIQNISNNVEVVEDGSSNFTRITVDEAGIYNFAFSLQLRKTTASTGSVWLWAAVNGTAITRSARKVQLAGSNAVSVATGNFFLNLKAKEYFQLICTADNTGSQILAEVASSPVPAIPSSLLTVNFVSVLRTNANA